jgi:hypothetical protein
VCFEDGPFNVRRAAVFTALGSILIGPALHFWCDAPSRQRIRGGQAACHAPRR